MLQVAGDCVPLPPPGIRHDLDPRNVLVSCYRTIECQSIEKASDLLRVVDSLRHMRVMQLLDDVVWYVALKADSS